jgi:glycosyltransferase involved in cell wall biosynthesis
LGFVGSLTEQKGWRIAVEAVTHLAAAGRHVRLFLAGSGPDESAVREAVRRAPDLLKYIGRVPDARAAAMPTMDALAVMSVHEGLPMVIIEAMSLGIPVLATGVGGIPEAVLDGVTGRLLPRDARALANAVAQLMDDPATLARLSSASITRFGEHFDIRHIVSLYDRVYKGEQLDGR